MLGQLTDHLAEHLRRFIGDGLNTVAAGLTLVVLARDGEGGQLRAIGRFDFEREFNNEMSAMGWLAAAALEGLRQLQDDLVDHLYRGWPDPEALYLPATRAVGRRVDLGFFPGGDAAAESPYALPPFVPRDGDLLVAG